MEEIIRGIQLADEAWEQARAASESPPPDADFPRRLRALADACEQQAAWLLSAAQTLGFEWTPVSDRRDMVVSNELRPGANRPGPPPLWGEFDRRVQRLELAMTGSWMYYVAWAYRDLAEVMYAIADHLGGGADQAERAEQRACATCPQPGPRPVEPRGSDRGPPPSAARPAVTGSWMVRGSLGGS